MSNLNSSYRGVVIHKNVDGPSGFGLVDIVVAYAKSLGVFSRSCQSIRHPRTSSIAASAFFHASHRLCDSVSAFLAWSARCQASSPRFHSSNTC